MTGPEKVEGFKARDGRIFDNREDAIKADMCQIIIDYAENNKIDVNDLFSFGQDMKRLAKNDDFKRAVKSLTCVSLDNEMDTLYHWITRNMELLELMMSYYVETKIESPKEEAKK